MRMLWRWLWLSAVSLKNHKIDANLLQRAWTLIFYWNNKTFFSFLTCIFLVSNLKTLFISSRCNFVSKTLYQLLGNAIFVLLHLSYVKSWHVNLNRNIYSYNYFCQKAVVLFWIICLQHWYSSYVTSGEYCNISESDQRELERLYKICHNF